MGFSFYFTLSRFTFSIQNSLLSNWDRCVTFPLHIFNSHFLLYQLNTQFKIHIQQFICTQNFTCIVVSFLIFFFSKFSLKMLSVSLSLDHTISVVVSSNFHFNDNRMAIQLSVECRRSVLLDHSHGFYEYHRDFWGSEISFLFSICSLFFIQKFVYWNMYGYIKALNRT